MCSTSLLLRCTRATYTQAVSGYGVPTIARSTTGLSASRVTGLPVSFRAPVVPITYEAAWMGGVVVLDRFDCTAIRNLPEGSIASALVDRAPVATVLLRVNTPVVALKDSAAMVCAVPPEVAYTKC